MNKPARLLSLCAGLAFAAPALGQAEYLMVVNSATGGGVSLLNPQDGALLTTQFIKEVGAAWSLGTPKEAIQVNNEIWLTDQIADRIFRFDLNGAYISQIGGELNNMRGLGFFNGHVYVTSADASGGTPANSIVKFDADGNRITSWVAGNSPFDVLAYNGELLVTHFTSNVPDITRWDENGTLLGTFHEGTINLPQQINARPNGNILAAGFSTTSRIFEYTPAGVELMFFAASGPRGVHHLTNGNIAFTTSAGISIYDATTQTATLAHATAGDQYISPLSVNLTAVGACCLPDGSCSTLDIAACAAASGVFRGDGTACGVVSCPALGACCLGDGSCQFITAHGCDVLGGVYSGEGITCAAANCPQPGACCLPDGSCTPVLATACVALGATFNGPGTLCGAITCPTLLPTPNPTATASAANSGIFFDVTAINALEVTQLAYFPNSAAGVAVTVDVYTRPGSYVGNDTNPAAWPNHFTFNTTSVGGTVTPTIITLPANIPVAANDTLGVYIVGTVGGLRYRASASPNPVADANMSVASDLFRSALFAGTATAGRRFAGRVYYSVAATPPACYANCDGSTAAPILNVQDFGCFLNAFAAGDSYANCDGSTAAPVLNVQDFGCFLNAFAAGCS